MLLLLCVVICCFIFLGLESMGRKVMYFILEATESQRNLLSDMVQPDREGNHFGGGMENRLDREGF